MELNAAIEKIRKYLDGGSSMPIVVDVPDMPCLNVLRNVFNTGSNKFVDAGEYCSDDSLPQTDKLLADLQGRNTKVFLTGLSTYLKLLGKDGLNRYIIALLNLNVKERLVVVTFQCHQYLSLSDRRIMEAGRYIVITGSTETQSRQLYFVAPQLAANFDACAAGLNKLSTSIEGTPAEVIYIKTKKTKHDFPNSLFEIKQYSSAFDVLTKMNAELASVDSECGTDAQWEYLTEELKKYSNWHEYVEKEFGGSTKLALFIGNLSAMDAHKRWAYFIAMRVCGVQGNSYLEKVVARSMTLDNFYDGLYTRLLEVSVGSKQFHQQYEERRQLLHKIAVPTEVVANYCKLVTMKGEDAIRYLTDATIQEKESIIEWLDTYAEGMERSDVEALLRKAFPSLHSYLGQFNYGEPLLNLYFNAYKYNKVINRIPPEFRAMMEEQAEKREYNSLLPARSSLVAKLDKKDAKLYFVDALGVEYLSYIQDLCYGKHLAMNAQLARCELPSITCINKDFVEEFTQKASTTDLDKLKHEGTGRFDYTQTKLPIHIIEEFSIINRIVDNVEADLNSGSVKKIYIISDHGASRLAVINNNENKWEISEKGIHSGRCCPKSDISEKPDVATEENDFWCLANYDRFKGGRKANVEVHGGASLEEVTIPIIEIRKAGEHIKCEVIDDYKVITVGFRKKAKIQLFVATESEKIVVELNGKSYQAVPSEQKYVYDVDMPDVKKGVHTFDVYDANVRIAEGLTFEAKSAGASENKYF